MFPHNISESFFITANVFLWFFFFLPFVIHFVKLRCFLSVFCSDVTFIDIVTKNSTEILPFPFQMDAETDKKLTETLKSSKDESETHIMDNKAKSVH